MKFNLPALCVVACLAPAAAFAKCDKDVKTVFSCQTAKGKVIEVCDAGKTISYSFGLPTAKPEIVVTVPRAQASTSQWEGVGRYMSYSVNIPNGNGVYSVYWAADRMSDKHGIEAGAATNYRLASVSKQFTAAAIEHLVGIESLHGIARWRSRQGQFRQVEAVAERVGGKWFWMHAPFYLLGSRLWQCASEMVQCGMLECRPVIIT